MGDYTDDTLVEYVIVLLKNGRRKEEARNELNVFLGDDSDSFVSWLWDHLRSNLNLYAQSKESRLTDEQVSKQKPLSESERETVSKLALGGASRRLLQFAVRDAVGTPRSTGLTSERSNKRLRSAVSTPTHDSPLEDRLPKIRSVARVPKAMAVAIKAVADAAQDVIKVKPLVNVFDRLGRGSTDTSDTIDRFTEDGKHKADVPTYSGQYVGDVSMIEHDGGVGNNDSRMLHYNAANVVDGISDKPYRDQNIPVAVANSSHKMVNIYSNVNKPRVVSHLDSQKLIQDGKPVTVSNGNGVPVIHAQREVHQKTLPSAGVDPAGRSTEDVDSCTIFVSNVHFAATKDGLSRHFNKFGDVLKVVILTEPASGQPKGSAYVEFMRKEAAEKALSLDGTSFLSRILKVVKKSSANQLICQQMRTNQKFATMRNQYPTKTAAIADPI
ncbi:hypothetical protein L1987_00994 [Smallanthus sonchifolius]|uniref:Uncharacterized protein n=1 Tax=Smallanthus sonchifolius TaxID=185202 RepID=A0ACB9K3T0_9ASTR|nr:hypothetical protein L1987_00994 [Smallanthus sonchifolius]